MSGEISEIKQAMIERKKSKLRNHNPDWNQAAAEAIVDKDIATLKQKGRESEVLSREEARTQALPVRSRD